MRHDRRFEELEVLDDYKLEDQSQDIRGMPLVGPEGERYGIIKDLLVDPDQERVAAVRLEDGRTTAVEPLDIHDNCVVYGAAAREYAETGVAEGAVVEEEVIPVVEERVAVGKRVNSGRDIRITSRVGTERVVQDVPVRDETVSVERRSVGRTVTGADAEAMLKGKTVTMHEDDEEVVVGKEAVVTDEVVVKKTAADRVEHVEEEVRKTQVDVEGERRTTR